LELKMKDRTEKLVQWGGVFVGGAGVEEMKGREYG
jgi:hypothetical protein